MKAATFLTSVGLSLTLVLSGCATVAPAEPLLPAAYIEPALLQSREAQVAVIVTAEAGAQAADAVRAVGGTITSDLWLIDAVGAEISPAQLNQLAAQPGILSIVLNRDVKSSNWDGWVTEKSLPSTYDGRPDAQPTGDPTVWDIVNPVAIDIGADQLHDQGITGDGVTVAVIDSGVYFDSEVRAALGPVVEEHFLGQADFVTTTCATQTNPRGRVRTVGKQGPDYCMLDHHDTADGYGHGTAVASIIWNNFTDANTGSYLGVAPNAQILSVRVLNDQGIGSYETVIKGIQFAVKFRRLYNIGVMNLSISAEASAPYFVDPLNRAVERAWQKGITVFAAAGNNGPSPESITVPGNDPYIITIGAVDSARTPGYWLDDSLPTWSATGPTRDGFAKPDLVAPGVNILTFMHRSSDPTRSQRIVQMHPDNAESTSLFRMSGTSMSTAVAAGVAALILEANPNLSPDQIKHRLMSSARAAAIGEGEAVSLVYPIFRQGMGRIWAPDAALGEFDPKAVANEGMNLKRDLNAGYDSPRELSRHYQGPVSKVLSDDGSAWLYYIPHADGFPLTLGVWGPQGWMDRQAVADGRLVWSVGRLVWSVAELAWVGGETVASGRLVWSVGRLVWSVNQVVWSDGRLVWSVNGEVSDSGRLVWSVGRLGWSVGVAPWVGGSTWAPTPDVAATGRLVWSVANSNTTTASVSATRWVDSD